MQADFFAFKNLTNSHQLNSIEFTSVVKVNDFDMDLKQAVMEFQSRHVDNSGTPLKVDGSIGALTWEALFGTATVPYHTVAGDAYLAEGIAVAGREADRAVREIPPNSNRGPDVERYLATVGKPAGLAWCVAFVYFCFNSAALKLGREGPGMIFVIDYSRGLGHSGLIERVAGGIIETIEGNTDASRTREGGGVYRLRRKIADINTGFIDYGGLSRRSDTTLAR